jgi:hypothetical protein
LKISDFRLKIGGRDRRRRDRRLMIPDCRLKIRGQGQTKEGQEIDDSRLKIED